MKKVSKGSPVFDLGKLEWLNGRMISGMSAGELAPLVRKELEASNMWQDAFDGERKPWFEKLIDLLKERSRTIRSFPKAARPFLSDAVEYDPEGVEKYLTDDRLERLLSGLERDFQALDEFSAPAVEQAVRQRAEKEGVKAALLIHALRMLVVGEPVSPGIFVVLELAGKEKTLKRMSSLGAVRGSIGRAAKKEGNDE